jgi:hypothetical protein
MKTFEIEYLDPETKEWVTEQKEFDHSKEYPAAMWAEDYAYARADKGPFTVREIKP